jgi:hypothetical protein
MKKAVLFYGANTLSLILFFIFLFSISLTFQGCKRKKPDEILLVKNLITRWENGVILNSPDSLQAVFSAKKELVVKTPEEMADFVFNSGIEDIRVAGRSIRLYREEGKVQSAQADLTLSGNKVEGDSLKAWQGKLHLLLRKHKGQWGIVDYKFE